MTYFNKKEDVYHMELTPYGRYLLSIGKLNFKSYAFFDDDIVYNLQKIAAVVNPTENFALQEKQNETKTRIQSETPYMKPNGNYYSVESNYNTMESPEVFLDSERREVKFESFHYLKESIGDHEYKNKKNTNWKIDFLNNEMTYFSSSISHHVSGGQISHIPQVYLDLEYVTRRDNVSNNQSSLGTSGLDNINFSRIFGDGSYVNVLEEDVIIQIQELNSEYLSKNFKVEVFIEEEFNDPRFGSYKNYKPLLFKNQPRKIVNGLAVTDEQFEQEGREHLEIIIDKDYVEYYFELNVDSEIAAEEICALIEQAKERNFYISDDFRCEDITDVSDLDIYQSDIGPDDLEEC